MDALLEGKIYGETLSGIPLIVMHGLLGMSDNWGSFGRSFGEEMPVHLIDLRNHGRSFHSDAMSLELMEQDLLHYFEAHGIEKAHVLGHSLGGKVAMQFAIDYPEKVQKLIVADIAPKAYPPHHQDIFHALSMVDMPQMGSRHDVQQVLEKYIRSTGVLQFLLKNVYRDEQKQLAWRFNLKTLREKYEDFITVGIKSGTFTGETLFLSGEKSDYILQADIPSIKAQFPQAVILPIVGAGHWVQAENPEDFSQKVHDFLIG